MNPSNFPMPTVEDSLLYKYVYGSNINGVYPECKLYFNLMDNMIDDDVNKFIEFIKVTPMWDMLSSPPRKIHHTIGINFEPGVHRIMPTGELYKFDDVLKITVTEHYDYTKYNIHHESVMMSLSFSHNDAISFVNEDRTNYNGILELIENYGNVDIEEFTKGKFYYL
jgi:hypothetical protein